MSESGQESSNKSLCGLCNEKSSKYCCPRCDILYCSLDCYKSVQHINCSESFYKECINEELASQNVDEQSKLKMIDILKRMQNGELNDSQQIEDLLGNPEDYEGEEPCDSDDDEEIDLEERIKGLNLDDANTLWNALTQDERNDFEALLNQGDIGDIIPQWEPWWCYRKEQKLVQDIDAKDTSEEEALKKCPALLKVSAFSTLTKVKPSPAIRFNIANVLASYAFTVRYFNGEIDPVECAVYFLSICSNLESNANYEDTSLALEDVAQKCLQSQLIETDTASLNVMKDDVIKILQGPSKENRLYYCKAALSHLHKIFKEAKNTEKLLNEISAQDKSEFSQKFPQHTAEHLPSLDVSKVKKCMKKVEYYLSFIDSYGVDSE